MPVLVHPLEEITHKTGFQSPCTKLLIHLLVLLRQWKITFAVHQVNLFSAEFTLTQAAVVFSSLCELYLEKRLPPSSKLSDTFSKRLSFRRTLQLSNDATPGTLLHTKHSAMPLATDERHSAKELDDALSPPVFLSSTAQELAQTLLDLFSKRLGLASVGLFPKPHWSASMDDSVLRTPHTFPLDPSGTRAAASSDFSLRSPHTPYYPSPASMPSLSPSSSPLSANTTRPASYELSTSAPLTAGPFVSSFDHHPFQELIQPIINHVLHLAETVQSEFFGPYDAQPHHGAVPLKNHPSVKRLLQSLGEKALHAKEFPTLVLLLKAEVHQTKLTPSILYNYLNFFSQHPSLPLHPPSTSPSIDLPSLPDHLRSFPLHQSELLHFWWFRSKLSASHSFTTIATKLSEYLKEEYPMAHTLWSHYQVSPETYTALHLQSKDGEALWTPEDLAIDIARPLSITDLAQVFPCDALYGTTLGDWVIWRLVGWLYLSLEIENKIYAMKKRVPLAEHERPVSLIQKAMNQLRCKFGYTRELHQRLSSLHMKLVYRTYPMFSPRFHQTLRFLGKFHSQIVEILSKPFLHASDSNAWVQVWELARHTVQQWAVNYNLSIASDALQGSSQRLGDCTHMLHQVLLQAKPLVLRFFINPLFIHLSPSGYLWMHLEVHTTPFAIAPSTSRLILDPLSLNKICQAMSLTHPHIELIYGVSVLNGHWHLVTEASAPLDLGAPPYTAPFARLDLACHLLSAGWALSCAGLYLQAPIQLVLVNHVPKVKLSDLNLWISADHDNSLLAAQPNLEIYLRFLIGLLFCSEPGKVIPEFKPLVHTLTHLWAERLKMPGQDRDGNYFFKYAGQCITEYSLAEPASRSAQQADHDIPAEGSSPSVDVHVKTSTLQSETLLPSLALVEKPPPLPLKPVLPLEGNWSSMSLHSPNIHLQDTLLSLEATHLVPPIAASAVSASPLSSEKTYPSHPSSSTAYPFSSSTTTTSSSSSSSSSPSSCALPFSDASSPKVIPSPSDLPFRHPAYKSDVSFHLSKNPAPSLLLQPSPASPSSPVQADNNVLPSISSPPRFSSSNSTPTSPSTPPSSSVCISSAWKTALQTYTEGQGDISRAFLLFKEASLHYPMAYFYMAESYYFGSKIYCFEQDHPQAFLYYQKALEHNCLVAHVGLGDCMYFGLACARDLTQAQHHYMQALKLTPIPPKLRARAWAGLGDCQFDIGDYATALDAYLNATQLDTLIPSKSQPFKRACARLAAMYIRGHGVKKDLEKAKFYLKKARLCRREVLVKSEWFRAIGEPQKADSYLEEYLWRFPIDY